MFRLILAAVMLLPMAASAITPTWGVDFESVFDNSEGDATHADSKTFFFTRLAPEAGLRINSRNRIAAGVVWFQPIGCEWDGHRLSPTVYYRYESATWKFSMGMFPRRQLREEMPSFLWSDSLSYTQANIRGALVQWVGEKGFVDAYIDWRGMQSDKRREAFAVVAHGQWHPRAGSFFTGAHLMMNHLARRKNDVEDLDGVVDNFVANPYAGVNLTGSTPLDSLQLRVGPVFGLDRDRKFDRSWRTSAGAWVEITAKWKWVGIKNSFYAGGRLCQLYPRYGSLLYQAEPYYHSSLYNRTDIYIYFLRRGPVSLTGALDFHATTEAFQFNQRLMLTVTL